MRHSVELNLQHFFGFPSLSKNVLPFFFCCILSGKRERGCVVQRLIYWLSGQGVRHRDEESDSDADDEDMDFSSGDESETNQG